ncbi:MAG TPA: SDR family NAD(P)-dependent oxidoreductase [Tepidisphaeraceae bacterium]|nr:SDR family NAD(P)-dependent oxidoreductase [Tepidisphaeraceae bacterium]
MRKYRFAGGKAIVTGAASGIGEALVRDLGARGSNLVLLDRDVAGLTRVAEDLRAKHPGIAVTTVIADLSDRAGTDTISAQLAAEHPDTTLLINCAGVALGGTFEQVSLQDVNWLFDINFHATVTLTHHLLPVLRRNEGSHLANVSSVFGLFAPPGQVAYVSSKFAVRGFTESLRAESEGTGMGVTSIHPGGIKTAIATSARIGAGLPSAEAEEGIDRISRSLTISASDAADTILHGIERRKPRVLIGMSAKVPDLIARIAPGNYMKVLRPLM